MTDGDIHNAIALLKKQIEKLELPWLENMVRNSQRTMYDGQRTTNSDRDPFKVLISCILSLRTQDKTTGEASARLFAMAPDIKSMAVLSVIKIEKVIYPVGFYKTKAVRIKELCNTIIDQFNSKVPDDIDELLKLKGVGRKTANLVITLGYKKPGICVDTHVHRITNRWGYVKTGTPEQTEFALRDKLPKKYWLDINGLLVAFGQGVCRPISPICSMCDIKKFCNRVGVIKHR
jgi:endonuclease-3